jgi:hypothetical protein
LPTPPDRTLGRSLGQLALALLNATLLLSLALAVAGLLLISRLQTFGADTAAAAVAAIGPEVRGRIAGDMDSLRAALDRLGAIETRLVAATETADSAAATELAAIRAELVQLRAQVATLTGGLANLRAAADGGMRAALHRLAAEAERRLATP